MISHSSVEFSSGVSVSGSLHLSPLRSEPVGLSFPSSYSVRVILLTVAPAVLNLTLGPSSFDAGSSNCGRVTFSGAATTLNFKSAFVELKVGSPSGYGALPELLRYATVPGCTFEKSMMKSSLSAGPMVRVLSLRRLWR
ncbi:hypothetical protein Mapa_012228 [Marchantia paleacea]|nr:hypothetical protein Mapa_012228 [Marchantia paleacea]